MRLKTKLTLPISLTLSSQVMVFQRIKYIKQEICVILTVYSDDYIFRLKYLIEWWIAIIGNEGMQQNHFILSCIVCV